MLPLPLLLSLAMPPSDTMTPAVLERFLPPSIDQWTPSESSRIYRGREIFTYIDGAGEVYLAYRFDSVLVQRYARPGQEEILVEIFDMGTSHNAFGVYTYMQGRSPELPIGQAGEYRSGLLCFWRGRYCVYIRIDNENDRAKDAVLAIGKWIAVAIGWDGEKPPILNSLPEGAYDPGSLRYFYRHEILNTHFYVSDGNLFLLDDRTEALLARMKLDGSHLLVVRYPSSGQADSAYESVVTHLLPDAREPGVAKTENGKWTACEKKGGYLVAAFDAATRQNAANAITSVTARLP
jgi:hypothetical protein